ncbi:nucleotidyl transferase AbiEii/AbiGii toxin family protein [Citrobacter sp. RHBSTW-00535]|uniref:nucleotidyl transferase AbiEii/AbiGii toxin family protein n=1 Tax=unclassified Citrobacter TaxID=2644389 RepID=UPI0031F91402
MNEYKIKHHKLIRSVLNNFNADFFFANSIYFGGGTRIALEIDEYRESIDVDFLGNDSNLMIVFYVQIMPDDLVMQLHRF